MQVVIAAAVSWAVSYVFTPAAGTQEGPRLTDLGVQSSSEGTFVKKVYGTMMIAGNLTQLSNNKLREQVDTDTEGANFFSNGTTITTYSYFLDGVISICEGPVLVLAIKADAIVVRDFTDRVSLEEEKAMLAKYPNVVTEILPGDYAQMPPSGINSQGIAYRGVACHVIPDFPLADFGNRIPNMQYEVTWSGTENNTITREHTFQTPLVLGLNTQDWMLDPIAEDTVEFRLSKVGSTSTSTKHEVYRFTLTWANPIKTDYWTDHINDPLEGGLYSAVSIGNVVGGGVFYLRGDIDTSDDWAGNWMSTFLRAMKHMPSGPHVYNFFGNGAVELLPFPSHNNEFAVLPSGAVGWVNSSDQLEWSNGGILRQAVTLGRNGRFLYDAITDKLYHHDFTGNLLSELQLDILQPSGIRSVKVKDTWPLVSSGGTQDADIRDGLLLHNIVGNITINKIHNTVYGPGGPPTVEVAAFLETLFDYTTDQGGPAPTDQGSRWLSDNTFFTDLGIYRWKRMVPGATSLEVVLDDQMGSAGLLPAQYNNGEFSADMVRGYAVAQLQGVRQNINPLMQAFQFDVVESGYVLKSVRRGGAKTPIVIDPIYMKAKTEGAGPIDGVVTIETDETELPLRVNVHYIKEGSYEPGLAFATRSATRATRVVDIQLPLVLSTDEAAQNADKLLKEVWIRRFQHKFPLPKRYSYIEPTDILTLPLSQGGTVDVALITLEESGLILNCVAETYAPAGYTSAVVGEPREPLPFAGPDPVSATDPVLMDIPMLSNNDNEHRFKIANSHYNDSWRGASLYYSDAFDGAYDRIASLAARSVVGIVNADVFAPVIVELPDEVNSVTVMLKNAGQTLLSVTQEDLGADNWTNLAAIGDHGRWELFRFRDAVLGGDGIWTLSGLYRGLHGSDEGVSLTVEGDFFVLLTGTLLDKLDMDASAIGDTIYVKGLTFQASVVNVPHLPINEATYTAVSFRPYPPSPVTFSDDGSKNITIRWVRRARINGEWEDGGDVPLELDCTPEGYELDILNAAGTVVRTVAQSGTSFIYTTGMQSTDGVGGSPDFSIALYQMSQVVGRGLPKQETYP